MLRALSLRLPAVEQPSVSAAVLLRPVAATGHHWSGLSTSLEFEFSAAWGGSTRTHLEAVATYSHTLPYLPNLPTYSPTCSLNILGGSTTARLHVRSSRWSHTC